MTENLTTKTFKGAAWIGGASFMRLGLQVISVALLARLLTPQEYGIVGGALMVMELARIFYTIGLAPTLIQRRGITEDHTKTAFGVSLLLSFLTGLGLWALAPLLASLMQIEEMVGVVRILAFSVPFGAFNSLCEALLARKMKTRAVALRPLFSWTLATFGLALPLAWMGYGYWSLVVMQMGEVLLSTLVFVIACRKILVFPGFSRIACMDLWRLSLGFSLNQPINFLRKNADKFLIARMLGADVLGLYSRASILTTTAENSFGNIARIAVFPAIASIQNDMEKLRNAINKSLSFIALVTLPTSAFFASYAPEIINFLLGPQWTAAAIPFAILTPLLYIHLAMRNYFALFQALGKPHIISLVDSTHALLLIVGVWLTAPLGLSEVCLAVVGTAITAYIFTLILVIRMISLPWKILAKEHLRPSALAAIIAFCPMLLRVSGASGSVFLAVIGFGTIITIFALLWIAPSIILSNTNLELLSSIPRVREHLLKRRYAN